MANQVDYDCIAQWARNNPYYYTDGKRYFANPSNRKIKGLRYVGRFPNAREARIYDNEVNRILA